MKTSCDDLGTKHQHCKMLLFAVAPLMAWSLAQRPSVYRRPAAISVAMLGTVEPVDPKHLTQQIIKAQRAEGVLELHEQHGSSFNNIHFSAAWIALGRLLLKGSKASASRTKGCECSRVPLHEP